MKTPQSMRRSVRFTTVLVLGGFLITAQAALLVYEPFDYTPGQSLDGQGGSPNDIGMIGVWKGNGNGTASFATTNGDQVIAPNLNPGPLLEGHLCLGSSEGHVPGSAATTGFNGQNGNNPDLMWASRPLDPSIVSNFTLGATNWMSCVQAQNFNVNCNILGLTFCLGAGVQGGPITGDPWGAVVRRCGVARPSASDWASGPPQARFQSSSSLACGTRTSRVTRFFDDFGGIGTGG